MASVLPPATVLLPLCTAVMSLVLSCLFPVMLWPAYHCSFMAYCMSIVSAYFLWRLIMSRLDTLQQCISVDVRWKQFPSICSLAPLRGSKLAEITPDATMEVVVVAVIAIEILTITVFSRSLLHRFMTFGFSNLEDVKSNKQYIINKHQVICCFL